MGVGMRQAEDVCETVRGEALCFNVFSWRLGAAKVQQGSRRLQPAS
jgi:hypothetical protein